MKGSKLAWQVLIAAVIGVIFGFVWPATAVKMQILGDLFVQLIKLLLPLLLFSTVTVGIAAMGDIKKVGRVGGKAILYFEIVTTFALALGLLLVNVLHPGSGLDMSKLAKGDISKYTSSASHLTIGQFLLSMIPTNMVDPLVKGDSLQILFLAILCGLALASLGDKGKLVGTFFEGISKMMFKLVDMIMVVSPIGVFGAMAFTIGKFGIKSLLPLGKLVGSVYLSMVVFIIVVLGAICKYYGISIFKVIRYIKEEILVVLGTSSSESVVANLMEKMERYGCSKSVVSLVVPTGYSFNLDGTSIYLSVAAVFIAQLYGVHLDLLQQITIMAILMLTSKGAAAVTGGGFITLAATLTATHVVPVQGLALILGVDRFLSMARALVNLIGNAIATIIVSKWENEFDESKMQAENNTLKSVNGAFIAE